LAICIKKLKYNLILHTGIVVFFFLLSFVINRIPAGTFIAGGDFQQFINPGGNLFKLFFTWSDQGQGGYSNTIISLPFYIFQNILYNLGFSYSNIASIIMFLFFIISFYSFFSAIKIIDKNITNNIRLLSSAAYAINIFTFTIFTYSWWITSFFIIYLFIPLLFALFKRILFRFSIKDIVFFILFFFISTVGFGNPAFLAALLFLQFLLLIIFFITRKISLNLKVTGRILFVFVLQLFLSIYFLLPYYISTNVYLSKLSEGRVLGDFMDWISRTSYSISNILSLAISDSNYPFFNLYSDSKVFIAVSFGYIIFLIAAMLYQKRKKEKNWFCYFIFFTALFFLLMRLTPPFDRINKFIYALPGFSLFRSTDKLFVFYPFFYLVLLTLLLFYSKFSKKIINTILIIILVIPIPFYIGGIPKYLSYEDQGEYKLAVQIPSEYYEIKRVIDKDNHLLSVISLPFSATTSINWANYPIWNFVGSDVLPALYNKPYISANSYDHPGLETKLSFAEYNVANKIDKNKFIELLQKFSGQYILLHKDIDEYWMGSSKIIYDTISELESDKIVKKLDDNEYFTLYELDENYLVPLILSNENDVDIYFQKVSPVKYRISIHNLKEITNLEFHQSYDSQWRLYLKANPDSSWCEPLRYYKSNKVTEGKNTEKLFEIGDLAFLWKNSIFDDTHKMVEEYANSWAVNPKYIKENYPEEYYKENQDGSIDIEIVLYYKSQSYFCFGFIIVFGSVFIFFISYLFKKRKGTIKL